MIRRSIAGAILGVSLLLGSFAWSGFLALRTVFDPDRSREVAEELLDNDEVRAQLSENLAFAVGTIIPAEVTVSDVVIEDVTSQLLNDPAVEALVLDAFAETHAAFLGEGDAPESIDLSDVAATARASLVAASPQLEALIPTAPNLTVPLPTERIPNVKPVSNFLEKAVPVLAVLALGGAAVALFTTSDRPSILRRAGFWAMTTTAFFLAVGLGIPWLLRQYAPEQAEVLAALMTALLRSTLVPSIALGLIGLGLLALAAMWPAKTAARAKAASQRAGPAASRVAPQQPVRRATASAQAPRPRARYQAPPISNPPPQQPASPYPDARPVQPAGEQPASPYPDARPVQPAPPAAAAGSAATHSVFADVPPPTTPATESRSVFDSAAPPPDDLPPAADPFAKFTPRWIEGHGWLIHPDDPRPTPAEAVWVEGLGHVVRRPQP